MPGADSNNARLVDVELDESIGRSTPDVEHERAVAIFDLIEENSFCPVGDDGGPYRLKLSLAESRLVFAVSREDGAAVVTGDHLTAWTRTGYGARLPRPRLGEAAVITPPSSVAALRAGYSVQLDDQAR